MYSPQIDPLLIRPLYHLGKARKKPMTQIVSELLFEALVSRDLPDEAARHLDAARFKFRATSQPQPQKVAA
jgi:hypothetical protein